VYVCVSACVWVFVYVCVCMHVCMCVYVCLIFITLRFPKLLENIFISEFYYHLSIALECVNGQYTQHVIDKAHI
jgi:hypothetical protein